MRIPYDATQLIKYLLLQSLGDRAMRQTNTNALIRIRMLQIYAFLSELEANERNRSGSFLPADCKPTTSDIPDTSILSPSPPTDLFAHLVERTELPCSGT